MSAHIQMQLRMLDVALSRHRFMFSDEAALHRGIASVLDGVGLEYQHEFVDGPDRFDFLLAGGLVLEVKIKGSLQAALHQVARYATRPSVNAVCLVATTSWSRIASSKHFSAALGGKPALLIPIQRQAF